MYHLYNNKHTNIICYLGSEIIKIIKFNMYGIVLFMAISGSIGWVAMNSFGFTQLGVAAGSFAAGIQSWIGCVAVGSAFALAQSIGMKKFLGVPATIAIGAAVGVLAYFTLKAVGIL
jgi:hypothetical protein